jgi:hypothetical protein
VSNHVVGIEDIADQHQASDNHTDVSSLRGLHNTSVTATRCVQAQKVCVLSENNPPLSQRKLQVSLIICMQ